MKLENNRPEPRKIALYLIVVSIKFVLIAVCFIKAFKSVKKSSKVEI